MFQEADISVTTSPAVNTITTPAATASSATVATSAAAATATVISAAAATSATASTVTAAPIKIINDEVIRPACVANGSILRGLLTKNATSAGEEKVNLLEGLGDDFLINEPIDEQTIALLIEGITPAENAIIYNELVEQDPTSTELHKEEAITTNHSQALPTSISSPGTLSSSATGDEDDDTMLGPVSGGKRKYIRGCGGKGAKIFKPLIEEKSTASSKLFSQPEHKVLMRDYQNLIAQVEEQKRQYEERKRESQRMLISLSSRREEVEVQQRANKLNLHRLLEKFKKIQDMVQEQRKKCREDEDVLMSLLRDESRLMAEQDDYHEKLHWFDRRLLALRVAAEDH